MSFFASDSCFLIAEAGVNHNGDLALALRLVDAAKAAGADAVKFQTFRAERLVSATAAPDSYSMLQRLELSAEMHLRIFEHCRNVEIIFLSTPFDEESADLLERLSVPAFKIASGEITHLPFLRHVAKKKKPILLSTGMATLREVREAIRTLKSAGANELALLHCTSLYPTRAEDANLRAITTLKKIYKMPVGYSDHTLGFEAALGAVALGANIVEKHFTLDKALPGPDHAMSADPSELAALVRQIRSLEKALGSGVKEPAPNEFFTAAISRRSLVTLKSIREGEKLTSHSIGIKRPGTGLPPRMLSKVVGRRTRRDIPAGTLLSPEMLW